MYAEMLKKLYCQERKKLEEMWIYQEEAKLRLLSLRRNIADRLEERLTLTEMEGRNDIHESVKDSLFRERDKSGELEERISKAVENERAALDDEEKLELKNANYPAADYADYLYQIEKVNALEDALSEIRLFPEEVYAQNGPDAEK